MKAKSNLNQGNQEGKVSARGMAVSDGKFLIDGMPTQIRAGAIHYFRMPPEYWEDRLLKLKQCGLNAVETYIPWNLHEPKEGEWNFSGGLDLAAYLRKAQELGLLAIVRPGPYICSEWDFGGLPAWLLTKEGLELRCLNESYMKSVRNYFARILPILRELQYAKGGPVIMMQVENEYGCAASDHRYLKALYDLIREGGIEIPLFISDWGTQEHLESGSIHETLLTVNLRNHPAEYLDNAKALRPEEPVMVMELWSGCQHLWGDQFKRHPVEDVLESVDELMKRGASFSFYMFHGGTNFGFMNGAVARPDYMPLCTSYDTDALLDEAGNVTEKYLKVRERLSGCLPGLPLTTPKRAEAKAFGKVRFKGVAPLLGSLERIAGKFRSNSPQPMESYGQSYGYILYRAKVELPLKIFNVTLENLHDRAYVFSNGKLAGIITEKDPAASVEIHPGRLEILVENMGRCNIMRPGLTYRKGITGAFAKGQIRLFDWEVFTLPMDNLDALEFAPAARQEMAYPAFWQGEFDVDSPSDTYLRVPYGIKGFALVNGFNLGRYWNIGPQYALYVLAFCCAKDGTSLSSLKTSSYANPKPNSSTIRISPRPGNSS